MSNKLERAIEHECVAHAFREGFVSIKLDKAARSWPDRLFLGPSGQTLLVEFKRPGEKLRKQQEVRHAQLAKLGHPVNVITSFEQFQSLLTESQALFQSRQSQASVHPASASPCPR